MPLDLVHWLLALAPIVLVLVLMVGLRWSGSRAGAAAWAVALMLAIAVFGAGPQVLWISQLKGLLVAFYVLYILWPALLLYNLVEEAGAIRTIARGITRLTSDRVMQLLILGWAFSAFLQGVGGFGVPIAVVAPLLIGLGFDPVTAVVTPAVGHAWSITFGSMASSFVTLVAVTGLTGQQLAPWSAGLLGVSCFLCGLAVAHSYAGRSGLTHAFIAVLAIGVVMSASQYLLAVSGMWPVACFVAGGLGLAASTLVTRLPQYRGVTEAPVAADAGSPAAFQVPPAAGTGPSMSLFSALLPYLALIVIVVAAVTCQPLKDLLDRVTVGAKFPEVATALGWVTKAGKGQATSVFGHAGAMLLYASAITYVYFRARGSYSKGSLGKSLRKTVRSAVPSSIGIAFMAGFAMLMDHAGMTYLLAYGISRAVGSVFPIMSPFIGVLGAFMTGSNTNSNVIFAPMQKSTAELMKISTLVILGAQTAGGSLGSMIAPAKVMVGCSTAGLVGKEGLVMRRVLVYLVVTTVVAGLIAWGGVYLLPGR